MIRQDQKFLRHAATAHLSRRQLRGTHYAGRLQASRHQSPDTVRCGGSLRLLRVS